MQLVALVGGAALPAAIIIAMVVRADRARPEPVGLVGRSVLYGFLATIPAIGLELLVDMPAASLSGLARAAWTSFVTAALVEEGVKYFFLKRYILKNPAFDEVMDGIVYAACVSLGFAFAENLLYGMDGGFVLLVRAFTAVPMHAVATGIMGYWIGLSKREADPAHAVALRRKGFVAAILVHGFYDFFLFAGSWLAFGALLTLVFSARVLRKYTRAALAIDNADALYQSS